MKTGNPYSRDFESIGYHAWASGYAYEIGDGSRKPYQHSERPEFKEGMAAAARDRAAALNQNHDTGPEIKSAGDKLKAAIESLRTSGYIAPEYQSAYDEALGNGISFSGQPPNADDRKRRLQSDIKRHLEESAALLAADHAERDRILNESRAAAISPEERSDIDHRCVKAEAELYEIKRDMRALRWYSRFIPRDPRRQIELIKLLLAVAVAVAAVVFYLDAKSDVNRLRREAIDYGYARHDPATGVWCWIPPFPALQSAPETQPNQ